MPNEETKIVTASANKKDTNNGGEQKVQTKLADFEALRILQEKQKAEKEAKKAAPVKPAAKPSPFTSAPQRPVVMPFGKPMPKNAIPKKKSEVPQEIKTDETATTEPAKAEAVAKATEAAVNAEAVKAENAAEKENRLNQAKAAAVEGMGIKIVAKAESKAEKPAEEKAAKTSKTAETKAAKQEKAAAAKTENKKDAEGKTASKAAKAEPKAEKPAEKPVKKPVDYTPGFGVKIVRKAGEKMEVAVPTNIIRHEDVPAPQERKPKEYVGRRNNNGNGKPGQQRSEQSPRNKNFTPRSAGDKVVAFTAAPVADNGGRKGGRKDKDKRDKYNKFDEIPTDLSRAKKNKHSKYKDKTEVVDEEAVFEQSLEAGSVVIQVPITVAGFCEQVEKTTAEAIMALMKMGIMANINANLDEETAVLLGMELGKTVVVKKVNETETIEEELVGQEDTESDLKPRPPVITVMGHVDHGKTSLLDAIRNTNVTAGEAGGITQHIGASEVEINGQRIVFLDTPGHEAFTAMRARGAYITDIAVLVVAADDSVKPQTIESISHAKAAGVPIIVAINKIDKPAANIDLVKKDLAENGVLVEDWGGDTICVPVSAKKGTGIKQLLEMILLQAEVLELKANPNRLATGSVIEARLDKNRGPVATLLVTKGTIQSGQAIVAGTAAGRIRVMTDWKGEQIRKAGPSRAVEITGLTEVPEAGDEFYAVKDEKTAREIAAKRAEKLREEVMAKNASVSLEKLFSQMEEGEIADLNLILKADVQGSVGALEASLEKLRNENAKVNIIHTGVGAINESDVMLAGTSNAVIIGFNVRPSAAVQAQADADGIEIRTYRVIYEIIEDIENALKGMLKPEFKEVVIGTAEVRDTFKVPNVGVIAGAMVVTGKIARNADLRLVREGIVIHEGKVSSLKRFKDDAKEVLAGFECGIGIEKFNDIKVGDVIEAYEMQEVARE